MKTWIAFWKKLIKVFLGKASIVEINPVVFVGWKMATGTHAPWNAGGSNQRSRGFANCDSRIAQLIASREIRLTQFRSQNVELEVAALKWRHYFVYWTALEACQIQTSDSRNFVELGVCDGLTALYASDARLNQRCDGHFYLYDAWAGMRPDLLISSEKASEGSYAYLNLENTQRNLTFSGVSDLIYNKGYLPESFATCPNPATVAWLHIDLNSALPTIASLNFFWDRIIAGGLVLFDDFAWPGYEDTRRQIEAWSDERGIAILHLPTGQAIISKREAL